MYQNVLMRIYCVLQLQKLVSFNIIYNEIREDKALCLMYRPESFRFI